MNSKFTRRNFVKTSALATGTLVAGTAVSACTQSNHDQPLKAEIFPLFIIRITPLTGCRVCYFPR